MTRRQLSVALNEAVNLEPLPIEDLEESTVEDYKKLNEKCDKVMSKIKVRKEKKPKK